MQPDAKVGEQHHYTVVKNGGARTLTIGRYIPAHWAMVSVELITHDDDSVTVKIIKRVEDSAESPQD